MARCTSSAAVVPSQSASARHEQQHPHAGSTHGAHSRKALAARIVYREGTDAVESLPSEHLPAFAIEFLAIDDETRKLARTIEESDLPDRDRVADLLRKAGLASAMGADHNFTG